MKICTAVDCKSIARKKTLCIKHYNRKLKYGDANYILPEPKCSVEGCEKRRNAKGLCIMHWTRNWRYGDSNFTKHRTECSIKGCTNGHDAKGLCLKHFNKERRDKGYFKKDSRKSRRKYTSSKYSAITTRKVEWTITFEEFKEINKLPCHYCKGPLPETRAGLDRIDNNQGYLITNVVPCCFFCNRTRSNSFTYGEFLEFSKTELFVRLITRQKREHNQKKEKILISPDITPITTEINPTILNKKFTRST